MLIPSFNSRFILPLTLACILCMAGTAAQAQNQLEFSLQNHRISKNCEEYTVELWVRLSEGNAWEITNSEIGISYNTDALTAQDLSPAYEANQSLLNDDVDVSQSPGSGYVRLTLLKSLGTASIDGTFKLLTLKFDIDDASLMDDLKFITTDPTTKIFDNGVQLNNNCGGATCYGVNNPKTRKVGASTILGSPKNTTVCSGNELEWSIDVNGCNPAYDWQKLVDLEWESQDVSSSVFSIDEVAEGDAGRYRVVVAADDADKIFSDEFTLTVNSAPAIKEQPEELVVCEGDKAGFSVVASGTPAPTFEWQVDRGDGFEKLGESGSQLVFAAASADQDGNVYRARISNSCGEIFTEEVELIVDRAAVIVEQPRNFTACETSEAEFYVEVDGRPFPDIQWEIFNPKGEEWVEIEEGTSETLLIEEVDSDLDGAMFRAVVSNDCGKVVSKEVRLTIHEAPVVETEIEDVEACEGDKVTFEAEAAGVPTPNVHWETRLDGEEEEWEVIKGANEFSYSFTPKDGDNGRFYRAVFSNDCGVVTTEAQLAFFLMPEITKQPGGGKDVITCENEEVSVGFGYKGNALKFVWRKDGEELEEQTSAALNFEAITLEDAGEYDVTISNDCDEATSETFNLVVNSQPQITQEPQADVKVCFGEDAHIEVRAAGSDLNYQWQKFDGKGWQSIKGANERIFDLEEVDFNANGQYRALVGGACKDTKTSSTAVVTVQELPRILSVSGPETACELDGVAFKVQASGTDLYYQWYFNGNEINGAVGPNLTINPVQLSDEGRYHVVVGGACQPNVTSKVIDLELTPLPDITDQPNSMDVCMGGAASFQFMAEGPGPLALQWQYSLVGKEWEDIEGATSGKISFASVEQKNEGYYRAYVIGECPRRVYTEPARLVIHDPVTILQQPESISACENEDVSLYVGAIGTPKSGNDNDRLDYRWYKDNSPLPGGFHDELRLDNIRASQAGTYRVKVIGLCSEVWSQEVEVMIEPAPEATIVSKKNLRVFAGGTASWTGASNCDGAVYQWYRGDDQLINGERISGADTKTLTITGVTGDDRASDYHLRVTCDCGSVDSERASLEIDIAEISFITQPADITTCDGEEVCFLVNWDAGGQDVNLQWLDNNDNPIAGADEASYCTSDYSDGDSFKVRITLVNDASVTTVSDPGRVTVQTAPVISTQPQAMNVCAGETAVFTVELSNSGVEGTAYSWFFNGTDLQTGGSELTIENVSDAQLGDYYVVVVNGCGQVQSQTVTLALSAETAITEQPSHPKAGQNFDFNELFELNVGATGEGACTYQWQYSADNSQWDNIVGENANEFATHITSGSDVGWYRVLVECECGDALASEAVEVGDFGPTSVGVTETSSLRLEQNYPNPFRGVSTIGFELKRPAQVQLIVRDMFGRQVAAPLNAAMPAGRHNVQIDATALELGSGTYSYTVIVDGEALSRRMIVVR